MELRGCNLGISAAHWPHFTGVFSLTYVVYRAGKHVLLLKKKSKSKDYKI